MQKKKKDVVLLFCCRYFILNCSIVEYIFCEFLSNVFFVEYIFCRIYFLSNIYFVEYLFCRIIFFVKYIFCRIKFCPGQIVFLVGVEHFWRAIVLGLLVVIVKIILGAVSHSVRQRRRKVGVR